MKPKFALRRVLATPGAMTEAEHRIAACLAKSMSRAIGELFDSEDAAKNDETLKYNLVSIIMSAYPIDESKPSSGHGDNTLWIITAADRSHTTVLLPDEY